jgi:hypothetical protein
MGARVRVVEVRTTVAAGVDSWRAALLRFQRGHNEGICGALPQFTVRSSSADFGWIWGLLEVDYIVFSSIS